MSKIICDICGTSYPETAEQCPICGSARPDDAAPVDSTSSGEYTYVRGGRFSKSNVRKLNRGKTLTTIKQPAPAKQTVPEIDDEPEVVKTEKPAPVKKEKPVKDKKDKDKKKSGNRGLIITIVVLLVAVLAVVGYIIYSYFASPLGGSPANLQDSIACTSVTVDESELTFEDISAVKLIKVKLEPANTTDKLIFTSEDTSVVKVDSNGKIEVVGAGKTNIRVKCGEAEATIAVTCNIEEPSSEPSTDPTAPFVLTRKELTLTYEGMEYILYAGEVDVADIFWNSENDTIATIQAGVVKAVSEGKTTVHAEYKGTRVSCSIECKFTDDPNQNVPGSGGNIGEDTGDAITATTPTEETQPTESTTPADTNYHIYNPFNLASWGQKESTIKVGQSFTLQLRDSSNKTVEATWTSDNESICKVENGKYTGVGTGTTYIKATCNNVTVSFKVTVTN